jgi:hypothetical protein
MGANAMHPELPATTSQDELVGSIIERLMVHDSYVQYAARVAESKVDLATMDMLIKHSGTIEHWLYILGQHLCVEILNQATMSAQQTIKAMPRIDKAKPAPMQDPAMQGQSDQS